jgi:hypothetical protein
VYSKIIERAKERVLSDDIYKEQHHILPKSLGGSDSSDNLVFLTGREHLVCHLLLIKMTDSEHKAKMVNAAWSMANLENIKQTRTKLNSRQYSFLREQFSKVHSRRMIANNPMHREEVKEIHRKAVSFRGKTEGMTGKSHTDKTKKLLSQRNKGQFVPEEKRKAASIFHTNRPDSLIEKYNKVHASTIKCEHCGKLANPGTYARWHGQKCKLI